MFILAARLRLAFCSNRVRRVVSHSLLAMLVGLSLFIGAIPANAQTAGWSSIKAIANNNFVSADNYGNNPLIANRTTVQGWEEFQVINNSDGTISLLAHVNNKYVTADLNQGGKLIARATTIQQWEKFRLVDLGNGTSALQALANNQYVSCDLNSGSPVLVANRAAVGGAWEAFILSGSSTPPPPPPPTGWPAHVYAPYAYTWEYPTINLAQVAQGQGLKYFTLAFMLSSGGNSCRAAWNGSVPLDQSDLGTAITNLRNVGGDVIVSFGGASGRYLEDDCSSVSSLAAQYQAVVDRYGLTYIDFDVENDLGNATSSDRRSQAIAQVQATQRSRGKSLRVSFTLGVSTAGMEGVQLDVLRSAISRGVDVGLVNIMTMDYGFASNQMGANAISAANGSFNQLKTLFPGRSDAQIWGMLGITPMIGINDTPGETFTLANAQEVFNFSQQKNIGLIAMWALQRDKQCPAGTGGVPDNCSGVSQAAYAFSAIFKAITH